VGHGNLSFTSLETADGPLSSDDYLMAFLGAITSIFLPHAVTAVPIPQLCSTVGLLAGYFTLMGPNSFPHPRSLCLL